MVTHVNTSPGGSTPYANLPYANLRMAELASVQRMQDALIVSAVRIEEDRPDLPEFARHNSETFDPLRCLRMGGKEAQAVRALLNR